MPTAEPREKPLVIFDGRCGFCRIWIDYWKELTGDRVEYAPSQEIGAQFPQIPPEQFGKSVQLAMPDGENLSGSRAVFQLLTYAPGHGWWLKAYDAVPGFGPVTEASYRFIAGHRNLFYWVTVILFGRRIHPASYCLIEWLFVRALALIYLVAFVSFGVQARGLIGSDGISPMARYLTGAYGVLGGRAYRVLPTVFWLARSDAALLTVSIAGAVIAVVLLIGFFQRACLICLFVLYLSIVSVGQDFLSFQWDLLLLETGFLAIFLGASTVVVWLFRLLLFRLMFSSGMVKIVSGDLSWRGLTAMSFHYFTQPLPTPVAWYMQQLPFWFQKTSTLFVFFIELIIPFFVFLPRRARRFGAYWLIALQLLILITGNYAFFNWLTLALTLFLFDDGRFRTWTPPGARCFTPAPVARAVAVILIVLGALQMGASLFGASYGTGLLQLTAPFGIVNSYGLFAVMTTTRPEITVQGSNDGEHWSDYVFKYKPGPLARAPVWVAPYQPRLDWQMWFAALSSFRDNAWFVNFLVRLLEGSPSVLRLLQTNPFPNGPPRYVRATTSLYRFTTFDERRATGNWWKAAPQGLYFPPISLNDVRQATLH